LGKHLVTLNAPGIRVEEERGPEHSITRMGCALTAFVGRTLRGPVAQPVPVSSFAQFQHAFGGLWQPSTLAYAVEQFFDNGGRQALIVRVVNAARAATLTLKTAAEPLTLRALRPGTREFLRASVDYDNVAAADSCVFNLVVQRVRMQGTSQVEDQEIYPRLSILPGSERYLLDVLAGSQLVEVVPPVPTERPVRTLDAGSGLATAYVSSNADGDDGAPLTDYDVIGSESAHTGLFALDGADHFNLLCIPPLSREQDVGASVLLVAERYCKERRALLVVDPPADWHTPDDALAGMRRSSFGGENAFMYFPRILAYDKLRGRFECFASCGAAAGMLARSDEASPVWGPAKIDDAIVRPGLRPSCLVTEEKRIRLAALGVNTIQSVRSATRLGVHARTLAAGRAGAADWQRLASRRLALFILNSVERGTRWVMFTPAPDTAALATAQVVDFFERLHASGAFGTRTPRESYFVICDRRINRAESMTPNTFHILIGFAAHRAGEFHSYRIAHSAGFTRVTPVSLNRLTMVDYCPPELEWVDALADPPGL
jgi:hypothetical protein